MVPSPGKLSSTKSERSDEVMSSSGPHEERGPTSQRFSCPFDARPLETVHELANTVGAMLLHAQVLDWKLPPYSRIKRPVREMERNAQRSRELLRRLLSQLEPICGHRRREDLCAPACTAAKATTTNESPSRTAAVKVLTHSCDACTSTVFPEGDDSDKH